MNLLLLLSALLSALSGVSTSVRQLQPASVVVQQAASHVIAPAQARSTARPLQSLPALALVSTMQVTSLQLPASEPLYLTRLRE